MTQSNRQRFKGLRKVLKRVNSWIEKKAIEQWTPMDNVVPTYRWSDADRAYYLNSCAGLIRYRPKTELDRTTFRDAFINRFDMIAKHGKPEDFFALYKDIRASRVVSYRANIRTRLKGRTCSLRRLL